MSQGTVKAERALEHFNIEIHARDRREVWRCCDGSTSEIQLVDHVPANPALTIELPWSQVLECVEVGVVDRRLLTRKRSVARETRLPSCGEAD